MCVSHRGAHSMYTGGGDGEEGAARRPLPQPQGSPACPSPEELSCAREQTRCVGTYTSTPSSSPRHSGESAGPFLTGSDNETKKS